jgi:hypothetical protein
MRQSQWEPSANVGSPPWAGQWQRLLVSLVVRHCRRSQWRSRPTRVGMLRATSASSSSGFASFSFRSASSTAALRTPQKDTSLLIRAFATTRTLSSRSPFVAATCLLFPARNPRAAPRSAQIARLRQALGRSQCTGRSDLAGCNQPAGLRDGAALAVPSPVPSHGRGSAQPIGARPHQVAHNPAE